MQIDCTNNSYLCSVNKNDEKRDKSILFMWSKNNYSSYNTLLL